MNQVQRKFLIEHIEKTYKVEINKHDEAKPVAPSLNNYAVAAILDGSFELRTPEQIRETIRQRAITLGPDEALIENEYGYGYRRRRHHDEDEDDDNGHVSLALDSIMELPPTYVAARMEYIKKLLAWKKRRKQLSAMKDTITLKLQLGSNQVLDKLIEQADDLCDFNLINAKLQITSGDTDDDD